MEESFLQRWANSTSPAEVAKVPAFGALLMVAAVCFAWAIREPFAEGTSLATFPAQALLFGFAGLRFERSEER